MDKQSERLVSLIEHQLDLESKVVDALEALNAEMSSLLEDAGIYGPKQSELEGLSPLLEQLQSRYSESRNSREVLAGQFDVRNDESTDANDTSLKRLLNVLPTSQSRRLDTDRRRIHDRLRTAQQKLTANQAVIFYSTEFHRRYLLGVLQCNVEEANYQADGHAFKLPTEKIIGQNC